MRHRPTRRLSAALLVSLAALPVGAQVQQAHVHGQAFADVAIDGERIEIQLRATAQDLVGFERAAANPEDEARVLAARKAVLDHAALWQFSVAAACVAEAPVLEVPGAAAQEHDHSHDHGHDHDHEHDEGHQHADWTARYRFRCANPAALRNIDTGLFATFPSLQSVTVQLIDTRGARGETLTPAAHRITLSP